MTRQTALTHVALAALAALAAMNAACSKMSAPTDAGAPANATANTTADVAMPAAVTASPADGVVAATTAKHFHATYTIVPGTLYVPDGAGWSGVKFKNDSSRMLGEGTLTLTVDTGGRISGVSEGGPLGNTIIDGTADENTLLATIRRKDPSDMGLTGTLVATLAGNQLQGTMKLSESNAAVVREATITAAAEAGQEKH
ncbi:MAG: hypothetical protein FWD73_02860 [Polyangiaceae bacterium]|nr:hypothetical protein [Polyangiaceae bacterium]